MQKHSPTMSCVAHGIPSGRKKETGEPIIRQKYPFGNICADPDHPWAEPLSSGNLPATAPWETGNSAAKESFSKPVAKKHSNSDMFQKRNVRCGGIETLSPVTEPAIR